MKINCPQESNNSLGQFLTQTLYYKQDMHNKLFIQLPGKKGIEIIPQEEIISISSNNKILNFVLENGDQRTIRGNLYGVEENLTHPCLQRCHQRHIVNLHKIKEVIKLGNAFVMSNNEQIPVSRSYKKSAILALNNICVKF